MIVGPATSAGELGRERQKQVVHEAFPQEPAEHRWAPLAQQRAYGVEVSKVAHHGREGQLRGIEADHLDLGRTAGHVGRRGGEHDDPRLRLGEQRDVGRDVTAAADGHEQRLRGLPAIDPPLPALRLAQQPSVLLGAECPGPDEHGIDLFAQAVKDGAVAVIAEAAGAAIDGRAAVDAHHEVGHRERPVGGRHRLLHERTEEDRFVDGAGFRR